MTALGTKTHRLPAKCGGGVIAMYSVLLEGPFRAVTEFSFVRGDIGSDFVPLQKRVYVIAQNTTFGPNRSETVEISAA